MPFVRITNYTDISFTKEKPHDYYTYFSLADLGKICYFDSEVGIQVQCIGIIYSDHGMFYLKSLPQNKLEITIKMSVINLSAPPTTPSIPTTVQVFGDLIWKNRPVILARMLNYISPNKALMLDSTMSEIKKKHCAKISNFHINILK